MRKSTGLPAGTAAFVTAPLGGGGFSTGIQFANDGTYVHQEDVMGAYVVPNGSTVHQQLATASSMPAAKIGANRPNNSAYTDGADGCYACAIAPNDSQRIYMTWNGELFKSTNQGASFSYIAGPYTMKANTGAQRLFHSRMVVDPQNANVFMLGPQQGTIVYSTDGGTTILTLTVSAGTTDYPHLVACDPSSSVVSSIKQKWAYSIAGTGIYQSTNGPGGTYSLLSGSPTNPCCMVYDASGNLWTIDGTTGKVYKKTPAGTMAEVTSISARSWASLAVNPQNTNQVVAIDGSGYFSVSNDGGTTWLGPWFEAFNGGINVYSTTVKWFGKTTGARVFPSQMTFHPTNNKLYIANGIGVVWCNPPTANGNPFWLYEDSFGDESLEADWVLCPPGGNAIFCVRDKGFFPLTSEDPNRRLNSQYFPRVGSTLEHGWHCDYVPGSPTHLVGCCSWNNNAHGYSRDGGNSWTQFSGNHPDTASVVNGGCIIPASDNDLYWFPGANQRAAQSHDNGATWSAISEFASVGSGNETGFGFGAFNMQRVACSDKTTGDVYCWNYGPTAVPSLKGIWKRAYGTSSFVQQCTSITGSGVGGYHARLICVPGNSGHLFFSGDYDTGVLRSTDGGQTWSSVANTSLVRSIACGKAAPGKTYPAIYFIGALSGAYGLYRSDDNCSTWVLMAAYPGNFAGGINTVAASQDVYGKVYLGTDHGGGLIGTYNSAFSVT